MTKYQKGLYNLRVKVFNMLPSCIKIESNNPKKFKLILQKFLYENSFYSLDGYFELKYFVTSMYSIYYFHIHMDFVIL